MNAISRLHPNPKTPSHERSDERMFAVQRTLLRINGRGQPIRDVSRYAPVGQVLATETQRNKP